MVDTVLCVRYFPWPPSTPIFSPCLVFRISILGPVPLHSVLHLFGLTQSGVTECLVGIWVLLGFPSKGKAKPQGKEEEEQESRAKKEDKKRGKEKEEKRRS